jgi:hypothetical protein
VFQRIQSRIGDEMAQSMRLPLTIETNFSLKIPARVDQRKVHESWQWADFCPDLVGGVLRAGPPVGCARPTVSPRFLDVIKAIRHCL